MPAAAAPHRYALFFDRTEFQNFDQALLMHGAQVGRGLDKSEVIRSLVRLFVQDEALRQRVVEDLSIERPPLMGRRPRSKGDDFGIA